MGGKRTSRRACKDGLEQTKQPRENQMQQHTKPNIARTNWIEHSSATNFGYNLHLLRYKKDHSVVPMRPQVVSTNNRKRNMPRSLETLFFFFSWFQTTTKSTTPHKHLRYEKRCPQMSSCPQLCPFRQNFSTHLDRTTLVYPYNHPHPPGRVSLPPRHPFRCRNTARKMLPPLCHENCVGIRSRSSCE